jgi:hypothetical protein
MENSKHTPGKIFLSGHYSSMQDEYREISSIENTDKLIGRIFNENFSTVTSKEAKANAERIVTLWNAMDGLSNEEVITIQNKLLEAKIKEHEMVIERGNMIKAIQAFISVINRSPAALYHYQDAITKGEKCLHDFLNKCINEKQTV